jgi:hypothetical protein
MSALIKWCRDNYHTMSQGAISHHISNARRVTVKRYRENPAGSVSTRVPDYRAIESEALSEALAADKRAAVENNQNHTESTWDEKETQEYAKNLIDHNIIDQVGSEGFCHVFGGTYLRNPLQEAVEAEGMKSSSHRGYGIPSIVWTETGECLTDFGRFSNYFH